MPYWTNDEIADSVFACVACKKRDDWGWIDDETRYSESGKYVYFDPETGKSYRSQDPRKRDDVAIWNDSDEENWIEFCEDAGWLIDEEWKDAEQAVDWIYMYLHDNFGDNNGYFEKKEN